MSERDDNVRKINNELDEIAKIYSTIGNEDPAVKNALREIERSKRSLADAVAVEKLVEEGKPVQAFIRSLKFW